MTIQISGHFNFLFDKSETEIENHLSNSNIDKIYETISELLRNMWLFKKSKNFNLKFKYWTRRNGKLKNKLN